MPSARPALAILLLLGFLAPAAVLAPLAECMLENNFDVTVISSSPLMEHDAMYMKVIYERLALRKEMKLTRGKAVLAH